MGFYLHRGGEQTGPFEKAQLIAKLRAGQVAGSDLVWSEGMAEWAPLSQVFPDAEPPAPVPTAPMAAPRYTPKEEKVEKFGGAGGWLARFVIRRLIIAAIGLVFLGVLGIAKHFYGGRPRSAKGDSPSVAEGDRQRKELNARAGVDFLLPGHDAKPEEIRALETAAPFYKAMGERRYVDMYAMLSAQAKASMTINQFVAPKDEAEAQRGSAEPIANVPPQQFAELMKKVEELYGPPTKCESLEVSSIDPKILSGQAADAGDKIEAMMSIGMIPATIAPATRRAALRGHIRFEPTADQLKTAAEQAGQSIEDMKKSEEYDPYFSLKAVLVEENGALKVGYFEFVPRSMLD